MAVNPLKVSANLSLGFIVGGASTGASMSAVIAHLAKNDNLSLPLTGQALSIGWFCTRNTRMHLMFPRNRRQISHPQKTTNLPAIAQESTIPAMIEWLQVDSQDPLFSPALFPLFSFKNLPPVYFEITGQDPFRDEGFCTEFD